MADWTRHPAYLREKGTDRAGIRREWVASYRRGNLLDVVKLGKPELTQAEADVLADEELARRNGELPPKPKAMSATDAIAALTLAVTG